MSEEQNTSYTSGIAYKSQLDSHRFSLTLRLAWIELSTQYASMCHLLCSELFRHLSIMSCSLGLYAWPSLLTARSIKLGRAGSEGGYCYRTARCGEFGLSLRSSPFAGEHYTWGCALVGLEECIQFVFLYKRVPVKYQATISIFSLIIPYLGISGHLKWTQIGFHGLVTDHKDGVQRLLLGRVRQILFVVINFCNSLECMQ